MNINIPNKETLHALNFTLISQPRRRMTAPASPTSPITPPEEMEVARVSHKIKHFSL